jgi:hypothetical protein
MSVHALVGRISHKESSVHGQESFKNEGTVFLENVEGRLHSKAKSCLRGTKPLTSQLWKFQDLPNRIELQRPKPSIILCREHLELSCLNSFYTERSRQSLLHSVQKQIWKIPVIFPDFLRNLAQKISDF